MYRFIYFYKNKSDNELYFHHIVKPYSGISVAEINYKNSFIKLIFRSKFNLKIKDLIII